IPRRFSLSALRVHLGFHIVSLKALMACFSSPVQIVLRLELIFIFCKSSITKDERIPFAIYWIGVQTEEFEFVVIFGKYKVVFASRFVLMPKFVIIEWRNNKEECEMLAYCWCSDGQV